jgi:hypothetical protein
MSAEVLDPGAAPPGQPGTPGPCRCITTSELEGCEWTVVSIHRVLGTCTAHPCPLVAMLLLSHAYGLLSQLLRGVQI